MANKSKDLDKFYTHPDIAKKFVDIINDKFPLQDFDLVLEPSAGSGNILKYLPQGSIGLDLEPESENVIKQISKLYLKKEGRKKHKDIVAVEKLAHPPTQEAQNTI